MSGVEPPDVKVECNESCAVCGAGVGLSAGDTGRWTTALVTLEREAGQTNPAGSVLCDGCVLLLQQLERARATHQRLRARLMAVLSRGSLLRVKTELPTDRDSEDEPLSVARSRRRKRKENVEVTVLGGLASLEDALPDIQCKQEPQFNDNNAHLENGYSLKEEINDDNLFPDDDASEDFHFDEKINDEEDPDDFIIPDRITRKSGKKKKVAPKVVHKCDQCDAKYPTASRLAYHRLKHDNSKPPFICEICGAHYKHKKACDIHIALHKGISDWKCEECNKLFPSKVALHRHNNIHTGKANYQCDLCGKSFIHTSSFKMHKLAHSGVKPHSCGTCGLALMTRSHLRRHERVHSGEKRHQCGVCGKRFSERYNLVAHGRAHLDTGLTPPAPAVPAPPQRRLFRCSVCPQRFERRYLLERHMETMHDQRLERPPPRPRNTMSKLLKAQAKLALVDNSSKSENAESETGRTEPDKPRGDSCDAREPQVGAASAGGGSAGGGAGFPRGWNAAYTTYMHHYSQT